MLRQLLILLCSSVMSVASFARILPAGMPALDAPPLETFDLARLAQGTWVKLPNGNVLYVRYRRGNGSPISKKIAMDNGLDDSFETASWSGLDEMFFNDGHTVLEFDSRGQGFTRYRTTLNPKYDNLPLQQRLGGDLSWKAQLEDKYELLKFIDAGEASLGLKPQAWTSVGLSYGGFETLALGIYHPEMVEDAGVPALFGFDPFYAPIASQILELKQIADSLIFTMPWLTPEQRLTEASQIIGAGDVFAEPKLLLAADGLGVEAIIAMGAGLAGLDMTKLLSQIRKGALVLGVGTLDTLVTPSSIDLAARKAGAATAGVFRFMGLPHRAITLDPIGAHNVFDFAISGKIVPGGKYLVNPFTNIITPVKSFGPEIGGFESLSQAQGSCKDLFN